MDPTCGSCVLNKEKFLRELLPNTSFLHSTT